ncbi:MAG: hypothetical protein NC192_08410, partial [Muribaculaceae bacterium]|nr:hypothetical protein [Muribaculaceae bacterium]
VHIKRLDYIVKPVAFLALTVHWFNPLIWAAFALMTRDMELSCDEAVLRTVGAGEKKAYSEALLRVSMKRSGLGESYGFLPLAFAETGIKGRVKNVLKYRKPGAAVTVIAAVAVAVACVALGTDAKSPADGGGMGESGIEYAEFDLSDGGLTSHLSDVNGNTIFISQSFNHLNKEKGDYSQRAFSEGDLVPTATSELPMYFVDFSEDFPKGIVMAADMTEFKINNLEISQRDGKSFLNAEFEFTLAEGAEVPVWDGSVRLDGKGTFMTGGGGTLYKVNAEYELNQSGEYGYAFSLNDFWDIPVYINKTLLADGDGYSVVTYSEYEQVYENTGKDGYYQVTSGNMNLSLEGYVPAYFACGLEEFPATGVVNYEWNFQNAYTGEINSFTFDRQGENCVRILGMSTKLGASANSEILDFGDREINEVTLEDMYTETSGGKTRLWTVIKVKTPDGEGLMNLMAVNDGRYEMAVAKLIDDEYLFDVITEYNAEEADSFGVIFEGFEGADKYVNNKLLLDGWYNVNSGGKSAVYQNAKPEKYYTGKDYSNRALTLYEDGTFGYIDYTSSAFPLPNPCGEYRRENGSLILTFDDGSELWFDEGSTVGEPLSSILTFNEAASRLTDARSRDIPLFRDGEAFELDLETTEELKAEWVAEHNVTADIGSVTVQNFSDEEERELANRTDIQNRIAVQLKEIEKVNSAEVTVEDGSVRAVLGVNGELSETELDGIVRLIKMSAEGVSEENIFIMDKNNKVLFGE